MADESAYDGPIVDAHHHIWDLGRNLYPWLTPAGAVAHRYGDYSSIKHDYLVDDFARDIAGTGVVASVYMEAEWDPTDPSGEVEYVRAVGNEGGVPGAMAAQAWLDAPDVAEVLAAHAASGFVRSVRHKPGGPQTPAEVGKLRSLMSDASWRHGYALLAEHGLHFELQTPWWNLPEAAELAREFCDTMIVVNHSGVVLDRDAATVAGWSEAIHSIAELPNVVVKASGLGVEGQPWTTAANAPIVRGLLSAFGADRVMFGSNFPVDGMFVSYRSLVEGYREITRGMPRAQQRAFFHDTAMRIYAPQPIAPGRSA